MDYENVLVLLLVVVAISALVLSSVIYNSRSKIEEKDVLQLREDVNVALSYIRLIMNLNVIHKEIMDRGFASTQAYIPKAEKVIWGANDNQSVDID